MAMEYDNIKDKDSLLDILFEEFARHKDIENVRFEADPGFIVIYLKNGKSLIISIEEDV